MPFARKRAPTWACVDRNVSLMYGSPRSGGGSSRHAVIAAAVQAAVYVPPTSAIGGAHSRPYCVRGLQRLLQARPRGGCAARCAAVAHATPHTRQQCPTWSMRRWRCQPIYRWPRSRCGSPRHAMVAMALHTAPAASRIVTHC
ncbi:hypothetical protein XCC2254 [Xanthomonas campestris pv. campestris str. ATCC 33913]|uniref:Uncharacterized protein n=1 Tax=Xanthomonas campestris pv. campestris (strain ATCC 33913 / DSM 3586 / NCPPB 528 / LMG 568 / P 25) TaxID=190485 RepID=Q8P8I7_XANCP|nr:hypothetical protein XCC2254 [Xanthomonas campestris pv. campestris str. ATCC 33913]